jgi:predicted nucleotide-binding protein (sugar kinase/HSP70/actin superfamily)
MIQPSPIRNVAGLTVGIPQALTFHLHPDLWKTFFLQLGAKVVLSAPTSPGTLAQASLVSEAEHCLPLKVFDAHLSDLVGRADAILIPRILSRRRGFIACPKLAALPDAARAEIAHATPVLTVEINENREPLASTLRRFARQLGAGWLAARRATTHALHAMEQARASRRTAADPSPRTAASGAATQARYALLLGHPYNLHDGYFSGAIARKLASLGVPVRLVEDDLPRGKPVPIRWDTSAALYETLNRLSRTECLGVVELSSFNCGCDSMTLEFFRESLRQKGIPHLVLVLDEHAGQAGMETRIEAFVDSARW